MDEANMGPVLKRRQRRERRERRLEGSRFGSHPMDLALSPSARVEATNFLKRAAPANDSTCGLSHGARIWLLEPTASQNVALGNSREPPV
jgi:hypothetical protein